MLKNTLEFIKRFAKKVEIRTNVKYVVYHPKGRTGNKCQIAE